MSVDTGRTPRQRKLSEIPGVELATVRASTNRQAYALLGVAAVAGVLLVVLGVNVALASVAAYRKKHDTMKMTPEEWDRMHAVTSRGTFLCMREAINTMLAASRPGAIINISSVSALRVNHGGTAYSATTSTLMTALASGAIRTATS